MELYIPNDLKQNNDMHDMETQASPTMIHMKQSDLRIIIDNTIDESSSHSSSKRKDSVDYIVEMVEKIKTLARKKTVSGNLWEYNTCHSCRGLLENKLLVHCIEKECSRYFCMRCMNKKFSINCEEIYNIIQLKDWTCFSCEGMCNCKICKDRFLENEMKLFSKHFGKSETSKRKTTESVSSKKSKNQEEEPIQIQLETSKATRTKKTSIAAPKSRKKREPAPEKKAKKEVKIIDTDIESEKLQSVDKKQGSPKNMETVYSKLRSKILAKKKLKEARHFIEDSSEEEIPIKILDKIEDPQPVPPPTLDRVDSNKDSKRNQRGLKKKAIEECHFCNKQVQNINIAVCSVEKCKKGFCEVCINESFQQDFTFKNYNPECWICYRCAGVCKCNKCSRKRTTVTAFKIANDDMIPPDDFKRFLNKNLIKKRPKFYDPITDDEDKIFYHNQTEEEDSSDSDDEKEMKSFTIKALQNKRKRLNKGPQFEKMIADTKIDHLKS